MLFEFTAYFEMSLKGAVCLMNTFKNSTRALTEPWGLLEDSREELLAFYYIMGIFISFFKNSPYIFK